MTAIGIKEILSPNLDKAFVLAGEIVRDCIFYKTESNPGTGLLVMTALSASVKTLVTLYGHRDIDGLTILFGDEKLIVRSPELASITNPGAGDYLVHPSEAAGFQAKPGSRIAWRIDSGTTGPLSMTKKSSSGLPLCSIHRTPMTTCPPGGT